MHPCEIKERRIRLFEMRFGFEFAVWKEAHVLWLGFGEGSFDSTCERIFRVIMCNERLKYNRRIRVFLLLDPDWIWAFKRFFLFGLGPWDNVCCILFGSYGSLRGLLWMHNVYESRYLSVCDMIQNVIEFGIIWDGTYGVIMLWTKYKSSWPNLCIGLEWLDQERSDND